MEGAIKNQKKRNRSKYRFKKRFFVILFALVLIVGKSFLTEDRIVSVFDLFLESTSALNSTVETRLLPSKEPSINSNDNPKVPSGIDSNDKWNLILVNNDYPVPEDYEVQLLTLSNGESVDERIYPYLQKMFDDMRAEGVYPVVASGYRSAEEQEELSEKKIASLISEGYSKKEAEKEAGRWINKAEHSEHQLGLAVDINADGIKSSGRQVYDWLRDNAWKYGFILRYPENKTEITGTGYEPWHYRYIGVEDAAVIYGKGICLEEYLEK